MSSVRSALARAAFARAALAWGMLASAMLAGLVAAAAADADTGRPATTEEFTQLADGTAHDLTVGRCTICHSLDYIPSNAPAMNRAGWEKTIQKMRDRFGAPITDEEARQILGYLAANYSGKP